MQTKLLLQILFNLLTTGLELFVPPVFNVMSINGYFVKVWKISRSEFWSKMIILPVLRSLSSHMCIHNLNYLRILLKVNRTTRKSKAGRRKNRSMAWSVSTRSKLASFIFNFFRKSLNQLWLKLSEVQSNDVWQVVGGAKIVPFPKSTLIFALVQNCSIPVVKGLK